MWYKIWIVWIKLNKVKSKEKKIMKVW